MHFALPAGRLQGQPAADAEPRPALRVRDAAVGEGQLPHQLRSGDQHADPGEGRIDLRPRAGQPGHATTSRRASALAYASTTKTVVRAGYGMSYIHFNRHGRREPAVVQRPARRRRSTSRSRPSQGAVRRQPGADDLLPDDAAGLSRRADTSPANFNPLNARVNYIPKDNPTRQRPELARVGAARAAAQPAGGRRLRRQQEPRHHDPRRLQPGAAERRRPRTRRCRRGGRSRASRTSRPPSPAARATTTRCRSRSSGATRAASTC